MLKMKVKLARNALGFLEVENKPSLTELRNYYAEKYFQEAKGSYRHSYTKDELEYFRVKVDQRARAVRRIRPKVGRFLDVGCGEGMALAYFRESGWEVEGIDFSDAGINAINPQLRDAVETGEIMSLLSQRIARGEVYDLVWLTNVLEHVLDAPALLTALHALVSEAGVLSVTVPNDFSDLQQMLLKRGCVEDEFWVAFPDHLSYFDRESLDCTARSCGWTPRVFLADFPIDLFLLHSGSNYVRDRDQGPLAHRARVSFELFLNSRNIDEVNAFYESMAAVGLGRNITAILTKRAA